MFEFFMACLLALGFFSIYKICSSVTHRNLNRWFLTALAAFVSVVCVGIAFGAEPVEQPFTVSAYQCEGILTIVPNTCGKVTQIEVTTDPQARFSFSDGVIKGRTTATEGTFSAVVCENNRCTPVEVDFVTTVYSGNTPDLADPTVGANTPLGMRIGDYLFITAFTVIISWALWARWYRNFKI